MGYTIREMTAERNFCQELTLEALHRVVPPETMTSHARVPARYSSSHARVVTRVVAAMV